MFAGDSFPGETVGQKDRRGKKLFQSGFGTKSHQLSLVKG